MVKSFTCEYCSKPFEKENCGTRVYRFCSYSCAVRNRRHTNGEVPTYVESPCVICDASCTRRVYPSRQVELSRITCSKKCAGVLASDLRGWQRQEHEQRRCEQCGKGFEAVLRNTESTHTYQYCSFSCSSAAKILKAYASGTRKPPGYSRRRHYAHGYAFRSKLELCYANELVEKGLRPGIDWRYEPSDLRVSYVGPDGEQHTYFPDFEVRGDIIEVKPASKLDDPWVIAKCEAAQTLAVERQVKYEVVTESCVGSYEARYRRGT